MRVLLPAQQSDFSCLGARARLGWCPCGYPSVCCEIPGVGRGTRTGKNGALHILLVHNRLSEFFCQSSQIVIESLRFLGRETSVILETFSARKFTRTQAHVYCPKGDYG